MPLPWRVPSLQAQTCANCDARAAVGPENVPSCSLRFEADLRAPDATRLQSAHFNGPTNNFSFVGGDYHPLNGI
ncbi:hypothetical protein OKW35_000413 [Paraburkholderia sp. MM5477-R1]